MRKRILRSRIASWFIFGLSSLVSFVFGYFFWKGVRYWHRLIRQPLLLPTEVPTDIENHQATDAKAIVIAAANVRAAIERRRLPNNREKVVLCAGTRNFREPWARDFGFASFGLLELEELLVARETLELFLMYQRPSGQFPVKIHSTSIIDRYLYSLFKREQPTQAPLKPKYITAHNTISLDGNALLVVAALNYARRTGDDAFIKEQWPALVQAVTWMAEHAPEEDGLLYQAAFADWADSIARKGRVLYTNVLYWKALYDMAQAAASPQERSYFEEKSHRVKQALNGLLWRNELGYYATSQMFDNLSSGGNLLAVAWGLATPEQAHSILDKMNEFNMADPVPTQVVHRPYPNKFIAIENRLGGIAHYHTSSAWLWLGAWHVIALARLERLEEAEKLLYRMARVIIRDGAVYEVYAPDGYYISNFWYTSEAPLTWSAGMVVYAYHVYRRHLARAQASSTG